MKDRQSKQNGMLRYLLVLPLLASIMLWGWAKYEQHDRELYLKRAKDEVFIQLLEIMERFETALNRRLFIPLSVESYVYSRGGLSPEEFKPLAENLYRYAGKGVRNLAVSVGTRIEYVYPLEGNEAVLGLDLETIKGQAETVRRTMAGRDMIIAGPYDLVQGGQGVITRKPIYLSERDGGTVWGMVSMVVDWPTLLEESGVSEAGELAITLRGLDATGEQGALFYGTEEEYRDSIQLPVTLPNGEWVLSGKPRGGWPQVSATLVRERMIFALLFVLAMAAATAAIRYPVVLERRVREATGRLAASHALLEERVEERTAALQESEERVRGLLESLPFPVVVTALNSGAFLYANERAAKLFEDSRERRGQMARDYYQNPSDRERLLSALQREGRVSGMELALKSKKGRHFWGLVSAIKTHYDGEEALLLSLTDITERKQIEEAHIASENNLRTIFDSVPTPMAITRNSDGRLVRINSAGLSMSGLREDSQKEFRAEDFYCDPQERARVMEILQREGRVTDHEVCMRSVNGNEYTFLMSAVFIDYDNEQCLLSSYAEFTERKKMELALQQANREAAEAIKAKNEFLATMSHEIRTPLNGALSMVKLLGQTTLDEQQREYLKAIDFSGESLLQILSDVLDLSKLEAGKLELEQANFSLHRMIDEIISLMKVQSDSGMVKLHATIDSRIPSHLCGDATRLRQILFNLLGNALKFTERGEVALQAEFIFERNGKQCIEFSVRDTGIGIPKEVQPRLFGDFTQADSSVTRRFGGSGLGLAICKRMVELMGGQIGVESEPGQGSRFWFRVELQRGRAPQAEVTAEEKGVPGGVYYNVLLVEDDAINRTAASALLRQQGWTVTTAADGYEALERVRDSRFDVVLMDVRMPGMDGLETTRRLREVDEHAAQLPVIALTADVTQENIDRCRAAGMFDVLSKPMRLERLREVLAGLPLPADD